MASQAVFEMVSTSKPTRCEVSDDLRHHLVELHVLDVGQRIVLAVDGAGLQARYRPRHRPSASGLAPSACAQELPGIAAGHASLMPARSAGVLIFLSGLRPTWRDAEIGRPEDLDAELVLGQLLHLGADLAGRRTS